MNNGPVTRYPSSYADYVYRTNRQILGSVPLPKVPGSAG